MTQKNQTILILIFILFYGCVEKTKVKVDYYSNGSLKSEIYKIENTGKYVHFYYDSIGSVESVITYRNGKMDGPFKYFYNLDKYRCEVGGNYISEKGIKQYEKLYYQKSHKLYSEVLFLPFDSLNWDNSHKSYDENGKLLLINSCFLEISTSKDSIKIGEDYIINFYVPCFDFKRTALYVGDFDEKYNPNGKIDTYYFDNPKFEYKVHATSSGEKYIRGYVDRYTTGEYKGVISKESKKLYFTKKYFVLH